MDHPHINNSLSAAFLQQLNALSPSDILHDENARNCFHKFLERDTAATCWQLVPEKYKALLSSTSKTARHNQSSRRKASIKSGSQPKRQDAITDENITQFFTTHVRNDDKRVKCLVRAVRGALEATQLDNNAYKDFWSDKAGFFSQRGGSRQETLYLSLGTAAEKCIKVFIAERLLLLYTAAEVDWFTQEDEEYTTGKGSRSVAYSVVSDRAKVERTKVVDNNRRSQNYYKLIERAGPGSILLLGKTVSNCWEREMCPEDVDLFLDCRNLLLPNMQDLANSLHLAASKIIIEGLLMCGWTPEELLSPKAPRLVYQVDLYLQSSRSSLRELLETKRGGDDLEQQSTKRSRTSDDGTKAQQNEPERPAPETQNTVNAVLCAPNAGPSMQPILDYDSQIEQEPCQAGSIDNVATGSAYHSQINQELYNTGSVDNIATGSAYHSQINQELYNTGSVDNIATGSAYHSQINQELYNTGSVDNMATGLAYDLGSVDNMTTGSAYHSQINQELYNTGSVDSIATGSAYHSQINQELYNTGSVDNMTTDLAYDLGSVDNMAAGSAYHSQINQDLFGLHWLRTPGAWNSNEGQRVDQLAV